ncbi:MAG: hypothetical protein GF331_19530 [Chitinivibrionales bacterium]|nr:hypothetical protein [Chitinivibrionales bacterium]
MSALPTGLRVHVKGAWRWGLAGVLVVSLAHELSAKSCPYAESEWSELRGARQRALIENPELDDLDPECMVALLERVAGEAENGADNHGLQLLARYAGLGRPVGYELLAAGLRLCRPQSDTAAWRAVCRQWEAQNGKVREQVAAYYGLANLRGGDTLYQAFDAAGMLSASEYLHWVTIRETLRDYSGVGEVLCRLCAAEPRLGSLARSRMERLLGDLDSAQVQEMLGSYRSCRLATPQVDTAALRDWLADAYARAGFYADELEVLVSLEAEHRPAMQQLVRSARRHFALKRFAHAAQAAELAWERTRNVDIRSLCATIAYESLDRLGMRDSAAVWLERTDLAAVGSAGRAVVFYQAEGDLQKADSLIRGMPEGLVRDTLRARQLLFQGEADSMSAYVARMGSSRWWRSMPLYARFWQLRAALFSGDLAAYKAIDDSLRLDPSWEHAAEALHYRYWHERVGSDAAARQAWGAFEREIYLGNPGRADSVVAWEQLSEQCKGLFIVRIVKAFIAEGDLVGAAQAAGTVDPVQASPEHTYYCAEVLQAQGHNERARTLLEQLILHHPEDIFSSKARVLLLKAQS